MQPFPMYRSIIKYDWGFEVMQKERISSIQMFLLLSGFLFGSSVILAPTSGAKNDAWLAIIIGGVGGLFLMWVYASIAFLNPSKSLIDILQEKFGKIIGNIIGLMYVWYFIHLASLVLRDFGEFICTVTYPDTPMVVVIGVFAIVLVYAVNSGIEVLGRVSEVLMIIVPIVITIISISLVTIHDFTAFLPVLENGMTPVLGAAFSFIAFPYGETVAFLMLFQHINKREKLSKIVIVSAILSILVGIFIFFRDISVLGGDLMARSTFISHIATMFIPGINVEPLVDLNLSIGGGIKIAICIYAAVKALSQIAGIDDYKKLTLAVSTFCVVLSIWEYNNIIELFNWADKVWPFYSIPFQIAIPLLLLLLSLRKRKA